MSFMNFHTILTLRSALAGRMQHSSTEKIVEQQHPIAFGILRTSKGNKQKEIRILFDSGATSSFLSERFASKLRVKNTAASVWKTGNGSIETYKKTKTQFVLPELYNDRIIEHTFHLLPTPIGYDMIVGTDLMSDLGIKLNFQDATVEWDEASIPFKHKDAKFETDLHIEDSSAVRESTTRMKQILDATYEKVELHQIVSVCTHLSETEHRLLHNAVQEYETLFDGTLGFWNHEEYNIELQPDAKPYHARAYPIPKIHEQTLRTEVDRLSHE